MTIKAAIIQKRAESFRSANLPALVILIALVVLFVFTTVFILGRIQESANRLAAAIGEEGLLKEQISAAQDYKKTAKEVRENLKALEDRLVNIQFPIDFVQFLEKQAAANNLSIEISSPSVKEAGEYAFFQLALKGAPADLIRFIAQLETGPYLLSITQANVQRSGQGIVSANISLNVLIK